MTDAESLVRALVHDLRTPLNVIDTALGELELAPGGERMLELADKSSKECAFALSFVQRGLDALSSQLRDDAAPKEQLQSDVHALLPGFGDVFDVEDHESVDLRIEAESPRLEGDSVSWSLLVAALRVSQKEGKLTCVIEAPDRVSLHHPRGWASLVDEDSGRVSFASLRPGYAAWILAAAVERGGLRFERGVERDVIIARRAPPDARLQGPI